MTRGEAAAIVNRMLNRQADRAFLFDHPGVRTFLDVPTSHWAYYDICEAANSHRYQQKDQLEFWKELL